MPRIAVLPDLLVNKIAAGEVIERPASVVKELVENSLDAGATRIEIAIEEGGRKLIRVTDDGCGMGPEDLALCIQPHATSKLRNEDDLFGIRTMGFRGEALPSIGSVSQLRIISRPHDQDAAHQIAVVGDRVEPLTAAAAPPGTTIEVRELFFNVPARQKFLRSAPTEIGHITEQLARIALVQPGVEFRLTHNGRLVHHLRPTTAMRARIADFYGAELAAALLEISREERGLKLTGLVSSPADSRSSAKWQYLFLNGRFIRDRFVAAAIREAYRGLMEAHRYPVIFMSLEVDPATVDVNVHPTKIEVRWQDSNILYSQVLSALRERFLNTDLTPALQTDNAGRSALLPQVEFENDAAGSRLDPNVPAGPARSAYMDGPNDAAAEARRREIRASIAEYFKRVQPGIPPKPVYAPPESPRDAATGLPVSDSSEMAPPAGFPRFVPTADDAPPAAADRVPESLAGAGDLPDNVIQVHRTYLVAETEDGLLIIDQHALHERILFEQLAERITQGPLESQRMLIPDLIDVAADHIAIIEEHADALGQLGFELTPYGSATIAVHAAPTILRDGRVREFLTDLLDRLSVRHAPASTEMLMNDLLSMMACKAAVKAGDPLTPEEIQALMRQRHSVDRSSNCPHGRPTSLRLTLRDLERQFKRA